MSHFDAMKWVSLCAQLKATKRREEGKRMNHDLVEFEESILRRTFDAKVFMGGVASVCECGWISPYFVKECEAIEAHENHQAMREEA